MDVAEPTFVMRIKTVGERWENSALINQSEQDISPQWFSEKSSSKVSS